MTYTHNEILAAIGIVVVLSLIFAILSAATKEDHPELDPENYFIIFHIATPGTNEVDYYVPYYRRGSDSYMLDMHDYYTEEDAQQAIDRHIANAAKVAQKIDYDPNRR